ncbi:MAG TPA: NUDIX domain-containing protein [Candidatus Pacearchaeota archaeon]|nr:NUDIX domain-containing protein [Candidatus Pacearchaeota archaeon]
MEDTYNPATNSFMTYVVGIVFDTKTKKILIGRCKKDPNFPEMGWAFPAGRPNYEEELEDHLKKQVNESTGLNIESLGTIFAKTYPENRKALSVYYLCEVTGGEEKAGGEFTEMKWVDPEELEENFKPLTLHPKLKEYILNLK